MSIRLPILFLFFCSTAFALQLPDINQLISSKTPKAQVHLLDSVAKVYRDSNVVFSLTCIQRAIEICKNNKLEKEEAFAYKAQAVLHKLNKNHDSVLIDISMAEQIFLRLNLQEDLSMLYQLRGNYFYRLGDFKNASKGYFQALENAEKNKDEENMAAAYNSIGNIFFYEGDHDKAIAYYKKSLDIHKKTGNVRRMASALDNIGLAYSNKGDLKSAIVYQKNALSLLEKTTDSMTIAESYLNLGTTYERMEQYDTAKIYVEKAYRLNKKINYAIGLCNAASQLGAVEFFRKNYDAALPYLNEGFDLANELELLPQLHKVSEYMYRCYEAMHDYPNTIKYLKIYSDVNGKLYTADNTKAQKELAEKYETDKKQKENELLKKNNEISQSKLSQEKTTRYALIIGIALVLLLTGFVFFRFNEKKRDNKLLNEKNVAIEFQNEQIQEQHRNIEEKNREITDSIQYAKRIQFSVLPSEKLLKSYLKNSFVFYQPKDIVSGDFYWFTRKEDLLFFAVADCTGHGVPGALMSMLGTSFLNQVVQEKNILSPPEILKELHRAILATLNENLEQRDSKDGMDIALVCIDTQKSKLTFTGAGRPLYMVKQNQLQIVKADKMSIGGIYELNEMHYSKNEFHIEAGTSIYIFSDGVPDQFGGPDKKKLMVKRVQEWILNNHHLPVEEQKVKFTLFMQNWMKDTEQIDDLTFAGIRF